MDTDEAGEGGGKMIWYPCFLFALISKFFCPFGAWNLNSWFPSLIVISIVFSSGAVSLVGAGLEKSASLGPRKVTGPLNISSTVFLALGDLDLSLSWLVDGTGSGSVSSSDSDGQSTTVHPDFHKSRSDTSALGLGKGDCSNEALIDADSMDFWMESTVKDSMVVSMISREGIPLDFSFLRAASIIPVRSV